MIFAELQYEQHYSEVHEKLVRILISTFPDLEQGLQGDSWIWIYENGEKVEVDSFSSMQHQIKSSARNGKLVKKVIELLSSEFRLDVYQNPELEAHE